MIKAFLLIFEPVQAWEKVVRAQRSVGMILLTYLLPMILLAGAVEGYGLVVKGKWRVGAEYQSLRKFPVGEAVVYEFIQAIISVVVVLVAAKNSQVLGRNLSRSSYFSAVIHDHRLWTQSAVRLSPVGWVSFG